MDLAGFVGDFNRHRNQSGEEIRKREAISESELVSMMLKDDRLKEIVLALRTIDPDRNGYVT